MCVCELFDTITMDEFGLNMLMIDNCKSAYKPSCTRKQLNALSAASNGLKLKLNGDKAHIIWLGTWNQLSKSLPQTVMLQNGIVLQFSTAVKNLGVLIDSQLTMANHIAAICQSVFFSDTNLGRSDSC